MDESIFLGKLAEIEKLTPSNLTDSTEIHPSDWDSIELLDLIAAMDETYGKSVSTDAIMACRTVGELRALIAGA